MFFRDIFFHLRRSRSRRRRYRGINLIYEPVINQGVPLHCLGKPTNTDAVHFTLHLKVTQKKKDAEVGCSPVGSLPPTSNHCKPGARATATGIDFFPMCVSK